MAQKRKNEEKLKAKTE